MVRHHYRPPSFVFTSCLSYTESIVTKKVLGIYLIWFIVINLFAFYSLNRLNLNSDTAYTWINPQEFKQNKALDLINLRVHWDSFWYLKIVNEGYQYIPGQLSSIAFFPLYPSLIWVLSQIPVFSPALAGWFISILSLGVGLIFLYKLVNEFHPEVDPLLVVTLLLIFPTAFFLNSVYTESLFLTLSVIFFYYLLKKQFILAAVFLSLASLCRINGLFLFVPFGYEYFKTFGLKRFINFNLFSFGISSLGILSFMLYQFFLFNEPLAFFKSQMEWGRKFAVNSEYFQLLTPASYSNLATDLVFFAVSITIGILILKKLRVSYGLYVLTTVLIAVSTGTLMSVSRFSLILFPIFILIASVKNQRFQFGWNLISILLLAIYTTFFVNNYWAG